MVDQLRPMPHVNDQAVIESDRAPTVFHEGWYLLFKDMRDLLTLALDRQNVTISDQDPTTDDIADGTYTVWNNTATPYVRLYANVGGTLYKVALT